MRKVYLISTFVAVLIGRFAWADASLTMDELREVIEVNPQMAFAKWAIKHPLDKTYAATTFQELSEGPNSELAGRRYAFVILHVPSKKVVLVLEEGKLEMGHNPHPAGGTDRRATFGIGTDYYDSRLVEFTFSVEPPKVLSKKALEPPAADPDMP